MGDVHPGTNLGIFLHIIGSRNTVPPSIFLIVPFGLGHIFFKLNSVSQDKSLTQMTGNRITHRLSVLKFSDTKSSYIPRTRKLFWTSYVLQFDVHL